MPESDNYEEEGVAKKGEVARRIFKFNVDGAAKHHLGGS